MYRKVVFLDIDGVLNTPQYVREAQNQKVMNPALVAILRHVVETARATIVISSSWRHEMGGEERIWRVFSQSGWANPPIVDMLPEVPGGRGREIASWLTEHRVRDFVIVDDVIRDMLPEQQKHIVHCDENRGFTALNAEEALHLLV